MNLADHRALLDTRADDSRVHVNVMRGEVKGDEEHEDERVLLIRGREESEQARGRASEAKANISIAARRSASPSEWSQIAS